MLLGFMGRLRKYVNNSFTRHVSGMAEDRMTAVRAGDVGFEVRSGILLGEECVDEL